MCPPRSSEQNKERLKKHSKVKILWSDSAASSYPVSQDSSISWTVVLRFVDKMKIASRTKRTNFLNVYVRIRGKAGETSVSGRCVRPPRIIPSPLPDRLGHIYINIFVYTHTYICVKTYTYKGSCGTGREIKSRCITEPLDRVQLVWRAWPQLFSQMVDLTQAKPNDDHPLNPFSPFFVV